MKRTIAVGLLFAFVLGCEGGGGGGGRGTGGGSGGGQPALETTAATEAYLEGMVPTTHATYEADAQNLEAFLVNERGSPNARQAHFNLIVLTDSRILPEEGVKYVGTLQGKKSHPQLVEVFEDVRVGEQEYYVARLRALYEGWSLAFPPETEQALRTGIAENYAAAEMSL